MLYECIKAGDRLEIMLASDISGKVYISQVEEVQDSRHLMIHMPVSYGRLIRLGKGVQYYILFFTDKGMISFNAEVMDYDLRDGYNLLQIKLLTDGERMQRRSFFRLNCVLPFQFSLYNESGSEIESGDVFNGAIKDIGGGGIRFVSNDDIPENSTVNCIITLEDELFVVLGVVLHKQHFPKSVYAYQYRVQFTGILQSDQEKIVQYIFNEQRKVIRKVK